MNDLVRELRELRGLEGLCADGCWGRCRVCPADAVQKAADRIESLQSRLAGAEKENEQLLRAVTETHQFDCICIYCEKERAADHHG